MNLTEEVLIGVTGVAITLIGFSGVVTALGRRESGRWSPQDLLQLRTLVDPSIISLFSAFAGLALGIVIANDDVVWKIANGVCFLAHVVGTVSFMRRGSTTGIHDSHKVGFSIAMIVMLAMVAGMFAPSNWTQLTYFLGLSLGIGISVHNFHLLLFSTNEGSPG